MVVLASLLALLAVREGMRLTLLNESFGVLRDEIRELELAIRGLHPDLAAIRTEFERKAEGHRSHGWFVELTDESGAVIHRSPRFPEPGSALEPRETVQFRQQDGNLLAWQSVGGRDIPEFRIVLGTPAVFIGQSIRGLTRSMGWIGAGLCLLAPVGGYLMAWWSLRPVRQIIETTRALQPQQMTRRLVIRGTGDELDQLSGEINAFLDQITRYISGQQEFTANAAHELRSPLTAIQTSVEVTLGKERSIAQYREELETVSEQCAQLRHLVNQLLELSEAETGPLPLVSQPLGLGDLIRKSVDVFSGVAEEAGIRVRCDLQPGLCLTGHAGRIRQLVNNLIDNALKFTPPGGRVQIRLAQDGGQIVLAVEDSGCGIPDAEKERIFDRFYQVDTSRDRENQRGNGLGLCICKAIVHQLNGTIAVRDSVPVGTTIEVRFPAEGGG